MNNPYGTQESNFLSKYLGALNEDDPKLLEYFITEAKKRKLLPKQDISLENLNKVKYVDAVKEDDVGYQSRAKIYGSTIEIANRKALYRRK